MKTLIIYDSFFGNTEKIAGAISAAIDPQDCTGVLRVKDVTPDQLNGIELLFVGSPTRGFRPTEPIRAFLANLPANGLSGVRVAAFDTRISAEDTKSGFLRFMIKLFGYAAKPIAVLLQKKGGALAQPPEGFYVKDSEGPLKEGELERATNWAKACRGS